jgi:hypothetical protein
VFKTALFALPPVSDLMVAPLERRARAVRLHPQRRVRSGVALSRPSCTWNGVVFEEPEGRGGPRRWRAGRFGDVA